MAKLIPKHQKGKPMIGTTVTNHYGDKTHYLPIYKDDKGDVNIGLPDIVVTPRNNLNLASAVDEGRRKAVPFVGTLVGGAVAPILSPVITTTLSNPIVNAALTVDGVRNALSGEGVQKTYKLAKEGDYWRATKSGVGDVLDLLGGLSIASKVPRFTPTRIRQGIYNNVMPGSYFASYAGNKRKEFKGAIKDILSGNTIQDNPKWIEWMENPEVYGEFKWNDQPKLATQIRMEAWKKSLGLPHKDKYLLKTGKVDKDGREIVTYNLDEIPLHHQQNFINQVDETPNIPIPDYIGNTGGWVAASKKDGVYKLEDLWDIQPFQNPNREGILPKSIKKRLANKILTPNSLYPYKWEWKPWVPKWFTEFDPTEVVGKGPFRNITELKPTKLSKEQTVYKISLEDAKRYMKEQNYDMRTDLLPFEDMSSQEIEKALKEIKNDVNNYVESLPLEKIEPYRTKGYTDEQLLNKYGIFTR